ncbi:hypothetical protein Tco_0241624 [Tanacetum coccineum]
MDEDETVPIILGRPFPVTARAVIDVHEGKLSLRAGNEVVTFSIGKSMKIFDQIFIFLHQLVEFYNDDFDPFVSFFYSLCLIKSRIPTKEPPDHLEYAFLQEGDQFPVVIASSLSTHKKTKLIEILMEDEYKPTVQPQQRVNPNIKEVVKKEVMKLLNARLTIFDSPWVSPVQVVPKKGGMTVVKNENNELIPQRTVTG